MARVVLEKLSSDVLDWDWYWKKWLDGDTIKTTGGYTITETDSSGDTPPLNRDSDSLNSDQDTITTWYSGGETGKEYDLFCKIVTDGGRTKTKQVTIRIVAADAAA